MDAAAVVPAQHLDLTIPHMRILIVEDDPTFRRVLTLLFDDEWTVEAVADAEAAIERIGAAPPDLVLVDFGLPGMDGLELVRRIHGSAPTRALPVIMVSGVASEAIRVQAIREGVQDFLQKPIAGTELRARVDALAARAEAQRRGRDEARRRLRESEQRFQLLVSAVEEYAIVMASPDGHVTSWNSGAERIMGYRKEEILGRSISVLYPEDRGDRLAQLLADAVRLDQTEDDGWLVRNDGGRFWANVAVTPVRDGQGVLHGFAHVTRDLTQKRRDESERALLLEKAEAGSRAKDRFLSVLSHELRSPLNAILGWVHVLRASPGDLATVARALDVVERNGKLQARLIDDTLDLSSIMSGRVALNAAAIDLVDLVTRALEAAQPTSAERGVGVQSDIEPVGLVFGDAARLQQVIGNLLDNALKYTPRGGQVAVALARVNGKAVVTVSDTGVGFPPEFAPRLFEPFERADASRTRQHGGLGVGLAIARQIVDLHHGRLSGTSTPGQGSVFTVTLPLFHGAAEVQGPVDDESVQIDGLDGVTILVVDDHVDALEYVTRFLTGRGARVLTADSAGAAFGTFLTERPDVILSDLDMPGESGLDLMQRIVALPPERGGLTPAAALTAYASQEDRSQALAAGFKAHVPKPVDPPTLIRTIAQLAASRRRAE